MDIETITTEQLAGYAKINVTDDARVQNIYQSLLTDGWQGAPVLVCKSCRRAVTGSHRIEAAKKLKKDGYDTIDCQIIDVSNIIDKWCDDNDLYFDSLPFDQLSLIFVNTPAEPYARQCVEW